MRAVSGVWAGHDWRRRLLGPLQQVLGAARAALIPASPGVHDSIRPPLAIVAGRRLAFGGACARADQQQHNCNGRTGFGHARITCRLVSTPGAIQSHQLERSAPVKGVVFLDLPGCTAMGHTVDEALRHAMEAGEWAQAVSLPRPRLLEALRDDSRVKAALADGAVLAVVPLIFNNSGKGAAAPAPRRASRVHCGSSGRRCLHAGLGLEKGTPVAPAVAPAPARLKKCPPNRHFLQALTSRISTATRSGRCWPAGRCWSR